MAEILFFAILAGYLFFRLWNVLGERTGFEKPKDMDDAEIITKERDNVVNLPNRLTNKVVNIQEETHDRFWDDVRRIQEKDKDFHVDTFLDNVAEAFTVITQAFVEGDKETLQYLLTEKTYQQFCAVIDERQQKGHRITNDILGKVDIALHEITMGRKETSITVKITSTQRFITYDQQGDILDNPEEISSKMTNYWTFNRILGQDDPIWYLAQTRVDA